MPRNEERASHFTATVPTVGDALIALDDLCHDLAETLKQISDISAELANKHQIGLDNSQELLREIDPALLRDLEIEQQRSLLCEELEHIRSNSKRDAKVTLDTLEMLLLLIWRHLEYYAEPSHMNMPPVKATVTNAMRLLATSEPDVFRQEVGVKIQPALQRLAGIELDSVAFGHDWQDNQGYIQIMTRRLRDSAGLHDESTMGGESDSAAVM
jgi:nuclear pore complex protein Nup205